MWQGEQELPNIGKELKESITDDIEKTEGC